jgi:hypothetical protein
VGDPPENVTVGADEYPVPGLETATESTYPDIAELAMVTAGPLYGFCKPMGCIVPADPSHRKPLPIPSNAYRSLNRDRTKDAGMSDPV